MLAAVSAASTPPPARAARKLRPSTLPDEILRELRGQLIRGDLQPGDRIRADLVAEELGVSVIPVREALRVLLAESRVELEPHRGYRVTVLSPAQIGEIFLICRLLEGEALRRGVPAMDAADDARMLALLADLEAAPSVVNATDVTLWPLIAVHRTSTSCRWSAPACRASSRSCAGCGITPTTTARSTCSPTSRRTSR